MGRIIFSKKVYKNLFTANIRSIFTLYLKIKEMKLTKQEKELIEAIRNFKKAKHNYSEQLEFWIREQFEKLLID